MYHSNAPLRATWGGIRLRDVTAFPSTTRFGFILPAYLPITPIWPGLLANTAIYTALIWLLCWLPAGLPRWVHRWRHPDAIPCTHCRYDLKDLTSDHCPECGHAIEPSATP